MWNRPVLFLWAAVSVRRPGRQLCFAYALPLPVLLMLADILEDFALPADYMIRHTHGNAAMEKRLPAGSLTGAAAVLKRVILQLIIHTGPTELADIETAGARIRCGLR